MKIYDLMNNKILEMEYTEFKNYLIEIIENNIMLHTEHEEEAKKQIEEIKIDYDVKNIAKMYFFELEEEGK